MGMPVITASDTHRRQAITDVIESVALQETALAHILNAEGEKLQRVINMQHVCPEELLRVNRSVEQTLRAVAQLDMILQGKLQLFTPCLCPWDRDDRDCDCDRDCD